jgi:hypothetical protein
VGASQYFSGGASGVNTCTIPGCTADTVNVPANRLAPLPAPAEQAPPALPPKDGPAIAPIDLPSAS